MQALRVRGYLLLIFASLSLLTSPTKNWTLHIGNSHTCRTWAWSFFTPNERSTNHSFKERNRRLSGICQCCENTTVPQWVQKQQKESSPSTATSLASNSGQKPLLRGTVLYYWKSAKPRKQPSKKHCVHVFFNYLQKQDFGYSPWSMAYLCLEF